MPRTAFAAAVLEANAKYTIGYAIDGRVRDASLLGGRSGGFALLPGFRTELTGLNHDEALDLVAGSRSGAQAFGLGSALATAMRKVLDALP